MSQYYPPTPLFARSALRLGTTDSQSRVVINELSVSRNNYKIHYPSYQKTGTSKLVVLLLVATLHQHVPRSKYSCIPRHRLWYNTANKSVLLGMLFMLTWSSYVIQNLRRLLTVGVYGTPALSVLPITDFSNG